MCDDIQIDEARIGGRFGRTVRGTIEETQNAMLAAGRHVRAVIDGLSAAKMGKAADIVEQAVYATRAPMAFPKSTGRRSALIPWSGLCAQ